jgi:CHAD domain-containing protein
MSYEIKIYGRIGPGLRDLAKEETARTLESLATMKTGDTPAAAHDARKRLKKLRALLALLREPLGQKRYRAEHTVLLEAGRMFSAKRDAETLLKTLKQLQRRFFPGKPSPVIQALQGALEAEERRCLAHLKRSNAVAACAVSLQEWQARIGAWPVTDYGWKELRQAVRRSYKRARKSYQDARDVPAPARLHRWRKRVKELWFHIRLLRRVCPALMVELAQDFEVLGEFLGDDHDLSVLKATLEDRRASLQHGTAVDALSKLIDLRREELLDAAFDLGERLHEDAPAVFVRELQERRSIRRQRRRKGKKLGSQLVAAA